MNSLCTKIADRCVCSNVNDERYEHEWAYDHDEIKKIFTWTRDVQSILVDYMTEE